MSYDCRIDIQNRIGVVTLTGSIDGAQIREAMIALFGHDEWQPGFCALWDAREVRSIVMAPEDLGAISRTMEAARTRAGAGRGAWVVKGEMAEAMGVLLAHRAQQRGHERRSFTDYHEALRWLMQDPLRRPAHARQHQSHAPRPSR